MKVRGTWLWLLLVSFVLFSLQRSYFHHWIVSGSIICFLPSCNYSDLVSSLLSVFLEGIKVSYMLLLFKQARSHQSSKHDNRATKTEKSYSGSIQNLDFFQHWLGFLLWLLNSFLYFITTVCPGLNFFLFGVVANNGNPTWSFSSSPLMFWVPARILEAAFSCWTFCVFACEETIKFFMTRSTRDAKKVPVSYYGDRVMLKENYITGVASGKCLLHIFHLRR